MKVKHFFAKKCGNSKIALIPRATLTACLHVYRYSAFSQILLHVTQHLLEMWTNY